MTPLSPVEGRELDEQCPYTWRINAFVIYKLHISSRLVSVLRNLRGWVFKGNGDQGKRRRTSDAWSVRDEGGPVAIQNPLFHTLRYGQEAVQGALSHSSQVQPTPERVICSNMVYN